MYTILVDIVDYFYTNFSRKQINLMRKQFYVILVGIILSNNVCNAELVDGETLLIKADSAVAETTIKQPDIDSLKKCFVSVNRMIQLSGYTYFRYRQQDASGEIDGFDIRRARLALKGDLTPNLSYRLLTEFAGSPKLLDAYVDVKIFDFLNFTIGQFKIPFSLENLYPLTKMESIDYAQVVDALVARTYDVIGNQCGRDIGFQVGGNLLKYKGRFLFDYKIGIFNGSGINANDKNENKDLAGRLVYHPLKGLNVGGSFYSGRGFYGTPTPSNQDRERYGIELGCDYKRFTLKSEFIAGKDGTIYRNGWYVLTCYYIIPQKLQALFKYDVYDPNTSISNNLASNYIIGGTYNFNSWSRIQVGYTFKHEQGAAVKNNVGAVQYQVSF